MYDADLQLSYKKSCETLTGVTTEYWGESPADRLRVAFTRLQLGQNTKCQAFCMIPIFY